MLLFVYLQSSLLQAILGEMGPCQGSVTVSGTVAYTSQNPWVFGGTLRENVLCGREFREDWYWKVIDACSLTEDLDEFSLGDFNQVGEHGLALSGGQRARVNLARCVTQHVSDIPCMILNQILFACPPSTS